MLVVYNSLRADVMLMCDSESGLRNILKTFKFYICFNEPSFNSQKYAETERTGRKYEQMNRYNYTTL